MTKLKDELITCKCGLCNNYFRVPRGALIGPFCKINQICEEAIAHENATIRIMMAAALDEDDLCPRCALIHFRAMVKCLEERIHEKPNTQT